MSNYDDDGNHKDGKDDLKNRKTSYLGVGIAIGVALGAALHNVAIGIALGVAIGAEMDANEAKKTKK